MTKTPSIKKKRSLMLKTVLVVLVILAAWYFLGPLIGLAFVASASAFTFLMTLLVLFALFIFAIPLLIGIMSIIFFVCILVLGIVAAIVFPALLPLLIIIAIVLLLIRLGRSKR